MWYYLIDYIAAGRGSSPALPKGTGFLLLAAAALDPLWGLFEVDAELPTSEHVRAITSEVEDALLSAIRYPPAMALARDEIAHSFDGQQPTDAEFCTRYAELLRRHMIAQSNAPYVLTRAIGSEPGYLRPGQFYWVLRYLRGSDTVAWVSSDYFVYHNPVADFDLSNARRDALLLPYAPA